MSLNKETLLEVENLNISFGEKNVVKDLSFSIKKGEIFCIVGESGSGKSLSALSLLKLLPDHAKVSSEVFSFQNQDLNSFSENQMQSLRGSEISMIFQEPMTSLNPVIRVREQVLEVIEVHKKIPKNEMKSLCEELFLRVGIAKERMNDYPHQLSGGMRQRVMIAMALACSPKLLVADEPTTALDVTIQGQILNLLKKLVKEQDMSLLLITHDLGVVSEIADTVGVMYMGEMMELASVESFFKNPLHPYSKTLMDCMPCVMIQKKKEKTQNKIQDNKSQKTEALTNDKILQNHKNSCSFFSRCPEKFRTEQFYENKQICLTAPPLYKNSEHLVRCHMYHNKNSVS